jgi:hypothetical protein
MTESNTAQLSTPSNTTTAPTSGNKETTDSVRFTAKLAHNSIKARCNNRIQTMAVIIAAAMLRIIDLVISHNVVFKQLPNHYIPHECFKAKVKCSWTQQHRIGFIYESLGFNNNIDYMTD